jgi:glycosyltransferase involved in cell wall biosynthesis
MVILHIAQLYNRPYSGVDTVVPKHLFYQQQKEDVALINLTGIEVEGVKNQFHVSSVKDLKSLPEPFDKPDVVIFHEVYRPKFLKIAKYFKKQGVPYAIVPHCSLTANAQKAKKIKKIIGNIFFFNSFVLNASAIQCLSEKEKTETKFKVEKFICPNGVELPVFESKIYKKDELNIVFIGRMDIFHKGLDILIDSIFAIKNYLIDNKVSITLYGPDENGSIRLLNKQICERNIEELIKIKKPVIGEEKKRTLLEADVFIQTSRFEGVPTGVLEALSYGLPCVVTEGTTFSKIIPEYNAGWGADGSTESVSNAIKKAVENKNQLNVFSKNARKLVEENFSWDIVADNTLRKYREKWANKK